MKSHFIVILTIQIMGSACYQQKSKMQKLTTEKELRDWYSESDWNQE